MTTKAKNIDMDKFLPIPHPGETLKEDFMEPLGLSSYAVARATGCAPITISMIIRGKRAISVEMAFRLGRYTGTGPALWINLQSNYERDVFQRAHAAEIEREVQPLQKAA